jgi:hypothetical protein
VGGLRLTRLFHARRGIPWLAIGVVATPAVALMVCAFAFGEHSVAWSLLRAGLLVWAATAAFVLDEPPAPVVRATPRSPSWWHESRFIGAVPLLVVPITAAGLWAVNRSDVHLLGITVQFVSAFLVVLAGAAVARRLGRNAPGDIVASSAVLVVLFLLIRPVAIRGVLLLAGPGDPRWPESATLWFFFAAAALVVIAVAGWRTPRPRAARSRA